MNMNFRLTQQQSTKLVMSTELMQAINILQYSTDGLISYLEEQQLENPLLEIERKEGVFDQLSATIDDYNDWNLREEQKAVSPWILSAMKIRVSSNTYLVNFNY
ncbi:MAG: hypothetical protein LRY71_18775 [Bacillaceae bacterium]|nr:hypothetical protein [Bacillaceae bacterium]